MNLVQAVLAENDTLPPIAALGYEYVVAANGLFIRAEDSRMEACVPVAYAECHGAREVEPYAHLKGVRISDRWLYSILNSARKRLPNEAMYQFEYLPLHHVTGVGGWTCSMPDTPVANPARLEFADNSQAVVDLHSHGALDAFFSTTDDGDEKGFRFYVVVGKVDTDAPEILCRVGVYGQHMEVPATAIFDGAGPFVDVFGSDQLVVAEAEQAEFFEREVSDEQDPF